MTFNEQDIVRDSAGRFDEKPQSTPEVGLPADRTFEQMRDEHATLFRESEEAALDLIHNEAPAGATTALFEWSEHGEFLEFVGYDFEDGTTISASDVIYGDNDADADVETYETLMSAANNVEAPYSHGLVKEENGWALNMDLTSRTASPMSREQFTELNTAVREKQATLETVAYEGIRDTLPQDAERIVFESDDVGTGLTVTAVYDASGAEMRLDDDTELAIDDYVAGLSSSPSTAARDAGLRTARGFTSSSGVFELVKERA